MSWDEVRSLKDEGFEIGVHTVNHVDLGVTERSDAYREIFGSMRQLGQQGLCPELFSYPYGRRHQMSTDNRDLVRRSGLRCCLSGYGGAVRPGDDPYELQRMPINPWLISPSHFGFELLFRT